MVRIVKYEQELPVSCEEAWRFFSTPSNLNEITPPELHFRIHSLVPDTVYPGLMIVYTLRPMINIPVTWVTEITHVSEGRYFVDEQRKGPYRIWHHEHHFEATPHGVRMTDILTYDVGKWLPGRIASWLFVDKKVKEIFEYRRQRLNQLFPQIK
jgi:ligand-binding SRPBCC domain-containing protein